MDGDEFAFLDESRAMPMKAIAFDWGHTVIDECRDRDLLLDVRPVHLMPGVSEVLPQPAIPLALWANTRVAAEADVRRWLERAGLGRLFRWVVTSVDADARKPAARFFEYALARCELARGDVLFVGNQLNSDVAGAEAFGIRTVWLSGSDYRSADDALCNASPTYTIRTLHDLPTLLQRIYWPIAPNAALSPRSAWNGTAAPETIAHRQTFSGFVIAAGVRRRGDRPSRTSRRLTRGLCE